MIVRPGQTEAEPSWATEARSRVWLGHRSKPQIVASFPREHAEQIVSPFGVVPECAVMQGDARSADRSGPHHRNGEHGPADPPTW
jgi:hypothetical protein